MENIAWFWMALGLVLIILELFLPSFFALFFGVSAIVVGLMGLIFPSISTVAMVGMFAVLSVAAIIIFFKFIKPNMKDKDGTHYMNAIGHVTHAERDEPTTGTIQFSVPVMGNQQWAAASKTDLDVGENYEVVGFDKAKNCFLIEKL